MSQFTDYGENKIVDFMRGQGLVLPANWRIAPLSAAADATLTEVVGSGISRAVLPRDLASMAGTQGAGTTLASNGTTHTTSNNIAVDMGTAAGAVGTVTHVGWFDLGAGGNCWCYAPLEEPIVTAADVDLVVPIGGLVLQLGKQGGMTDWLANKMIDKLFRGQAFDWPASLYARAYTTAPTNAGGGVEVGGGVGYGRPEIESTMDAWSGTQAAGSTTASSGTGGRMSNNAAIEFPDPTGPQGTINAGGLGDADVGGNLFFWWLLGKTLGGVFTPAPKTIGVGVPLRYQPNQLGVSIA